CGATHICAPRQPVGSNSRRDETMIGLSQSVDVGREARITSRPSAMPPRLNIVILGLSITSSWGNGHATTYRGLVRELTARKHDVLFLERDVEWYASTRDMPKPPYGRPRLYRSVPEIKTRYRREI